MSASSISRRQWLSTIVTAVTLRAAAGADTTGDAITIVAIVYPALPGAADVRDGIRLGQQESARAAQLLGRSCDVRWAAEADRDALARASALVVAMPPAAAAAAALARNAQGVPVLVISDTAALPSEPLLFVVSTGARNGDGPLDTGCEPAGVHAWEASLTRYGAGELNERFTRETGRPMSSAAWAAWAAVKASTEAALRAASSDAAAVARALRRLRFDAHKGRPLFFDQAQRLVQPMYRVAICGGKRTVTETRGPF